MDKNKLLNEVNLWLVFQDEMEVNCTINDIEIEGIYNLNVQFESINAIYQDKFHLKIKVPLCYPDEVPVVEELNKVIPIDYHMNGSTFCMGVEDQMIMDAKSLSIAGFMSMYLDCYLGTFLYYKDYKRYPFGERSHGYPGVLEFYKENFSIQDNKSIIELLKASLYPIGKNAKCPCGSGLKYKKCHWGKVEYLRSNVSREKIMKSYNGVRKNV